jgi:hypothetical protein
MRTLLLSALLFAVCAFAGEEVKGRYAIILQAGSETHEGMARAAHALLYARELAEDGYGVALIFDGAGTGWANELRKPENPLHKHYLKIKELGMVEEICDYCAEAFEVKDDLPEQQKELLVGEYEGHPSLVKWIEQGYEILIL